MASIDQPPRPMDASQRIGQRLANINGEPYRDPRSWFNRPIDPKPVVDAAKTAGNAIKTAGNATVRGLANLGQRGIGALETLTKVGGRVAPVVAAGVEGVNTARDVTTPGMTGLDQTARVAEGAGRFGSGVAGMAGGAALGALTGPLAPVAVPALSIAGGIAGAVAPDLVNKAYNWATGDDNQLASQKAEQLRAGQPPATAAKPNIQAAAGTLPATTYNAAVDSQAANVPGIAAPLPAVAPAEQPAAPQRAPAASPPQGAKVAQVAPAAGIGAMPEQLQGVNYMTLDSRGPTVAMNDGTQQTGKEAESRFNTTGGFYEQARAGGGAPVEVIRGLTKTVAAPELRYAEMDAGGHQALQDNGGIGKYTQALAQGMADQAAPVDAKARGDLEAHRISAGPGYAGVAQRAASDAAELAFKKEQAGKPVVVGGGQEPVYDNNGMYVGMRTVPGRLYDGKKQQWLDQPGAGAAPARVVGMTYTDAKGNKAIWNGKEFTPVK